jgi:hypothetical protein
MQGRVARYTPRLGARAFALAMTVGAVALSLAYVPAAQAKPPEVEHVIPNSGSTAGGAEVEIKGKVLAPNGPCTFTLSGPTCPELMVYFGNEPGFIFEATKTKILAFAPTHAAGTVDVTVVSPMGTSVKNKNDKFTYSGAEPVQEAGATPVVSSVEPNHGRHTGFNEVRIRGEHLTPNDVLCIQCNGDVVHFGTTSVVVQQGVPGELLVIAPPHATGTVDVTVTTNPGATSATSSADHYTYE